MSGLDFTGILEDAYDVIEAEDLEVSRLIPVSSSNLAAVGYSAKNRHLVVAFLDGHVYLYYDVEVGVYRRLLNAESHGEYFYHNIRMSYVYAQIQ